MKTPIVISISVIVIIILIIIINKLKPKMNQSEIIKIIIDTLKSKGVDEKTAKQWVTVAATETAGFTSPVFKASNNLFGLRVPGKPSLSAGENQTVYKTPKDSVDSLFSAVIRANKYPLSFSSIEQQANVMKQKGYYGGSPQVYAKNMNLWWNRFKF